MPSRSYLKTPIDMTGFMRPPLMMKSRGRRETIASVPFQVAPAPSAREFPSIRIPQISWNKLARQLADGSV